MRKCLLQMILWIIIAVIHSPCAYADAPLTIVVDAYNPPNMYLKDGKASGLYPLLLSTIFERMNENVVIDAVPWKRVLDMVNQGVAGAGGVYKTDDRLVVYDFSAPVYNELLLVFVRRGNAFKFETVSDLNGKHVGIILGWSYGAAFDKAKEAGLFSVDTVNRDHLNFKKLAEGRLDCVVASRESGLFEIAQNDHYNIIALETPLLISPTYVVFAKHADKKHLLARFDETLKQMREDGEYSQLVGNFIKHMAREEMEVTP